MSSRVGQVFAWTHIYALVVEELGPTRRSGSTIGPEDHMSTPDVPVYTLCVWNDSGVVRWPVERFEATLAKWEQANRRIA